MKHQTRNLEAIQRRQFLSFLTDFFMISICIFAPGSKPIVIFLSFLRNFSCYLCFMKMDIV